MQLTILILTSAIHHTFFRIEKEIFPEYKDEEVFLLDDTWEEDYIQKLGEIQDIVVIFSR